METGASTILTVTLDSVGEMLDIPDDLSPIITGMNDVTVTLKSGYPQTTDYTATYVYDIVSGSSTGNATATFTLDSKYTTRTIEEVVYIHVTDPTPSPTLFRGYEISSGFLKWDGDKFILSSGIDGGKGVSYFTWSELENATLPEGWSIPTIDDWQKILTGNGNVTYSSSESTLASNRMGFIKVTRNGVKGLLLIPDNTHFVNIPLIGNVLGDFSWYFGDTPLTSDLITYLDGLNCVFLPCKGYYFGDSLYGDGFICSYLAKDGKCIIIQDDPDDPVMYTISPNYFPVVLVKKLNP
jgi:hypothetical protein